MQTITPFATNQRGKTRTYPTYLVVGSTPGVELTALLEALTRMGGQALAPTEMQRWQASLADADGAALALEDIDKALEPDTMPALLPTTLDIRMESLDLVMSRVEEAALLLFYERPERLLLKAMSEEASPSLTLQKWCAASRSMLDIVHRHRKRAVLFDARAALAGAATFRTVCRKRFGLESRGEEEVEPSPQEPFLEVHRLIAAQMVVQSTHAMDLLDELEATAVPTEMLSGTPEVDCESVLAEWRGRAESDQLREENELLLLQLHQVQEELESYYLRLRETDKSLGEAEKKLAKKSAAIRRRDKSIAEKDSKYKTARAKVRKLESELAEATRTLIAIRQSSSWKVTKPLRGVRAFFTRLRRGVT